MYSESEQLIIDNAMNIIREKMISYKRDQVFNSPADVRLYLNMRLHALEREVFLCLFLDTQHRLIADEILFTGTIDASSVYPREVVKRALELNAAAVIFSHNHPSGVPEPSMADERITLRLRDALALVDVRVLDHVIVGGDVNISMAEKGLL